MLYQRLEPAIRMNYQNEVMQSKYGVSQRVSSEYQERVSTEYQEGVSMEYRCRALLGNRHNRS